LIGEEGWATKKGETRASMRRALRPAAPEEETLVRDLADAAESFPSIEAADLGPLMERIGSARVVLLGEATHGTSEFYRMRERITRDL
ncbi:protein-L-isoaspartate O-methyltransferase, partial [Pseudomonas sp. FW306-2-11AD]